MSQHMEALAMAQSRRVEAARQRGELTGAPIADVVEALIHPTGELASLRLAHLFTPKSRGATRGVIPRLGPKKLNRALAELVLDDRRHRPLHSEMRLRDLSESERRRLVRALIRYAPPAWRAAA
jgi:hypothetical protein